MRSHAFLIENKYVPNAAGYMDDWRNSEHKVMCKLVSRSYSKVLEMGQVVYVTSYKMFCYASPLLMRAIGKGTKWIIDGDVYTINGYDKLDNNNFYLVFHLNKD